MHVAVGVFALLLPASPVAAKYASLVIDAHSGRVLHSVNATTRNHPASLTKMMTLYMLFERLKKGHLWRHSRLRISARAARQPASRLGLKVGETISVEEAILALVTKSANDVAMAVAENLAGSERKFALAMTARARKLGMSRTTFRNASGLPRRGQLSTAADMAILARVLIRDYPRYYSYFSTRRFTYRGTTHKNHNRLLTTVDGVDGIKTGYIHASGFNLVASAKRDGQRLIGVVFGGRSATSRNQHMTKLLDKGFSILAGRDAPARLARRAPSKAPSKPPPAVTGGAGWGIQVGAYRRYSQARDMAVRVADLIPSVVQGGRIAVVPLRKEGRRTLYRARILGLDKKHARRACRLLQRQRIDCMEMRMRTTLRVAAAGG